MSSDEPFDVDADPGQPRRRPQPSAARGTPPGRRPTQRTSSRAREGGAATPVPSQRRPNPPRTTAPRTGQTSGRQAPPSYAPKRGESQGGGTRVMPGRQPARRASASSRTQPGSRPPDAPPTRGKAPVTAKAPRKRRRGRVVVMVLLLALALVIAWPVGLLVWANGKIVHTDAGTGGASPGTTYLLAGSDSRADGTLEGDSTEGERTDTIMLLTVPPSGATSLISLPRDTYVEIPGHGPNKLNASFAFGGAPLLVETVEQLTGIDIDHYVQVGMGGVKDLVDAVGGVELCLDYAVDDENSDLVWPEPGCREVDGETALAFARMRYSDPQGDIGRTQRQQQVIQAVTSKVADPSLVLRPGDQVELLEVGLGALTVSDGTGIIDLGRLALAFRDATGPDGVRGTPPISNLDYRPGGVGSTVLLDPDRQESFFASLVDGSVTDEDTHSLG